MCFHPSPCIPALPSPAPLPCPITMLVSVYESTTLSRNKALHLQPEERKGQPVAAQPFQRLGASAGSLAEPLSTAGHCPAEDFRVKGFPVTFLSEKCIKQQRKRRAEPPGGRPGRCRHVAHQADPRCTVPAPPRLATTTCHQEPSSGPLRTQAGGCSERGSEAQRRLRPRAGRTHCCNLSAHHPLENLPAGGNL